MSICFFAREKHHQEHAKSIADGFGKDITTRLNDIKEDYVCVFSYGDLKDVAGLNKGIIFAEHGVGMFYNNPHPSYAGSLTKRENVILRLSPNKIHADKEKETLECPVEIIGVPKLDKFANRNWRINYEKPTVAISFHFDCLVNPETRSSFNHFKSILPELNKHFNLIGHAHPRLMVDIEEFYHKNKIRVVKDFEKVMELADVYCIDNSSTIFEWCITNKPIVLLNNPSYRRDVEHKGNPRFWKHANIGPQCNNPEDLISCIYESCKNHSKYLPKIKEASLDVLSFIDGKCTKRAVNIIKKYIQ
jgi:hypothetical protein